MRIDAVRVQVRTMQRVDPQWRTSSYKASEVSGVYFAVEAGGQVGVGASAAHPRRLTIEELTNQLNDVAAALTHQPLEQARRILAGRPLAGRASIAVDLALHDLVGRLAGLPAETLWGGPVRDRINLVRMVGIKEPELLVDAVRPLYDTGVRAFKLKVGDGVERDIDRVRRVRQEFGESLTLMIDANGAYDRENALALCQGLGELDVHCVEQPLPYRDMAGMAELRAKSPVRLMADQMVESADDVVRVAHAGGADIVSLKLTKMGSVDECVRVAHVCAATGLGVHLGGCAAPGIVDSALTRLALSTPDIDIFAEVGESSALVDDQVLGVVYTAEYATSDGNPGLGGIPPVL
ncbi:enolase C-terminal domain-like protein [Micromonospora sp. NPDC023966]|uniref:mandelate racemase/muconate lactonizing enzyme family protein n=1 Tax=Micromonospora sp. NPDC023966 TaxID=3154699 RepID=UPI0033FF390F